MFACLLRGSRGGVRLVPPPLRREACAGEDGGPPAPANSVGGEQPRLPSSVPPPSSSSSSISRRQQQREQPPPQQPTELRAEAVLFDASDEGMTTITGTLNDADPTGGRTRTRRPTTWTASRGSDDGYTLSAPQRYSITDWYKNVLSIPKSRVLVRAQPPHLQFCLVARRDGPLLLQIHGPCGPAPAQPGRLRQATCSRLCHVGRHSRHPPAFRTSQSYERFWHGREIWARW